MTSRARGEGVFILWRTYTKHMGEMREKRDRRGEEVKKKGKKLGDVICERSLIPGKGLQIIAVRLRPD